MDNFKKTLDKRPFCTRKINSQTYFKAGIMGNRRIDSIYGMAPTRVIAAKYSITAKPSRLMIAVSAINSATAPIDGFPGA